MAKRKTCWDYQQCQYCLHGQCTLADDGYIRCVRDNLDPVFELDYDGPSYNWNEAKDLIRALEECSVCDDVFECVNCIYALFLKDEESAEYKKALHWIKNQEERELQLTLAMQKCWMKEGEECACAIDGHCPLSHSYYQECVERNTIGEECIAIEEEEEDEFPF